MAPIATASFSLAAAYETSLYSVVVLRCSLVTTTGSHASHASILQDVGLLHERSQGVVTRSELFGAFEEGRGPATKVEDFMLTNPIIVMPDQPPLTVAELMHKHDVDWLPVVENRDSRHVIGVIRSERMLRRLVSHMSD